MVNCCCSCHNAKYFKIYSMNPCCLVRCWKIIKKTVKPKYKKEIQNNEDLDQTSFYDLNADFL